MPKGERFALLGTRDPTGRVHCSRKSTRQQPVLETRTEDGVISHKASRILGEQDTAVLEESQLEGDGDTVAGTQRGALRRPLETGTVAVSAATPRGRGLV